MRTRPWQNVVDYLERMTSHDILRATDALGEAVEREGIGAISDAFSEASRSLMQRVVYPPGAVDIRDIVEQLARRITVLTRTTRTDAVSRQASLLVFLGSDGLACSARDEVAGWPATERLRDLVGCTIGLVGVVSAIERAPVHRVVARLVPPNTPVPASGTFDLAWRGSEARITFLAERVCSLQAIFARVTSLRHAQPELLETMGQACAAR